MVSCPLMDQSSEKYSTEKEMSQKKISLYHWTYGLTLQRNAHTASNNDREDDQNNEKHICWNRQSSVTGVAKRVMD